MSTHIARQLIENFSHEKQADALALFADDGIFEDFTFGFRVQGMEELTQMFARFFDPTDREVTFRFLDFVGGESGGAIEYESTTTYKAGTHAGKSATVRGAAVITLEDGRITRFSDYWDRAGVLRMLEVSA